MPDTFYINAEESLENAYDGDSLHGQLEAYAPELPIKVVCPGKVYRRDDDDATHSISLHKWKV